MTELNSDVIKIVLDKITREPGLLAELTDEMLDRASFYIEAELWDRAVTKEECSDER